MLQNANIQYYITLLINNFSINACSSLSDNTDAKDNKVVSGILTAHSYAKQLNIVTNRTTVIGVYPVFKSKFIRDW